MSDTKRYGHTQTSNVGPVLVMLIMVVVAVGVLSAERDTTLLVVVGLGALVVLATALNFSRLTVTVSDDAVTASFGRGWPTKRIPAERIVGATVVRNKWYHGWGLRRVRKGWMYNVSGLDAVELERADGSVFRIGTDEPDRLLAAIRPLVAR